MNLAVVGHLTKGHTLNTLKRQNLNIVLVPEPALVTNIPS